MGECKNKENLKSTNWLQNEKKKFSHGYIGEKKSNYVSVYPACLCSSDIGQTDQNQCSKCYLSDCREESPCLLLSVFISTLLQSPSEANVSKTRIESFNLFKPRGLPPFHESFLLKHCSHKGSLM